MRLARFKYITVSIFLLLAGQTGNALADNNTSSQQAGGTDAQGAPRTPAAAPATPMYYRGYPPRYYRGYNRPYGGRGPSFHGPWSDRSGSGFGFGSGSGPSWGSGPRFGRGPGFSPWDDDPFADDPFMNDPFFDDPSFGRGPGFNRPRWNRNGSSFGFGSGSGPSWGSGPGFNW